MYPILMPDGTAYELESKKNAESTPAGGVTKTGSLAAPINSANPTVTQQEDNVKYSMNDEESPVGQAISSAKTSIMQIPALFKDKNVVFGETNIDIDGGRFDLYGKTG